MELGENTSSSGNWIPSHHGTATGSGKGQANLWEIEEVEEDSRELVNNSIPVINNRGCLPLVSIKEEKNIDGLSLCSYGSEDSIYVGVGKSDSSMAALTWTLRHAVEGGDRSSTTVYLVHVFPEIRFVPSPLGNLPISRVNQEQLNSYTSQETAKRRDLLQKFFNSCVASQVKVDTVLIESDTVAKAIIHLIPVLNITKLVVGTSKSSLRKLRARRGTGVADQLLQNVPEGCDLKIICEGNEVTVDPPPSTNDQSPQSPATPSPLNGSSRDRSTPVHEGNGSSSSISCMCFRSKFI
ncbi:hypothetical protein SAY86_025681 [Trapa natans]|uniref:Uncharacterized protein n=1 Tax=Trapa natans TaxID=22666 RepID=A0AAN7KCX0_TRANT|nr:hypothetical protein SAY86_025681 [Trapa natans]